MSPPKHPFLLSLLLFSSAALAAEAPDSEKLGDLSLEQLLDVKVTSVAKREEALSDSPAAIFVITQEMIHRSGVTSIPEALRLAPGMTVARVDAHTWAISARGFNDVFANKLLVLIDGRSVYTPLYSGVFWDAQDVMMEDIDRIEVIRGPGASLWGANAVNGVINVITKSASQTQGVLAAVGGGTDERAFASVRYGGMLGDKVFFRAWGKAFYRDHSAGFDGDTPHDAWQMGRGGLRLDVNATDVDLITFDAELYGGTAEQTYLRLRPDENFTAFDDETLDHIRGGHVLGRWTRTISATSQLTLQTYYDRTERPTDILGETRDTFDVDLQHRFALNSWQTLTWGLGYRRTSDEVQNSFDISLHPKARQDDLFSAFLQDEIALIKDRLVLTLGSKFEHNDYTGFEVQPSGRLLFKASPRQSFWASVSRAVRTPSQAENDVLLRQGPVIPRGALFAGFPPFVPPSPAVLTAIHGDTSFDSEELIAYELGYRAQPHDRLSLDVALFYNDYEKLRSIEFDGEPPDFEQFPPSINLFARNELEARAYGGEIAATWLATNWLKLQGHYSYLEIDAKALGHMPDLTSERNLEGSSPRHQVSLQASVDLTSRVQFDAIGRWVDSLPAQGIDSYFTADVRLAWRPSENVEVSVVGQNLLEPRHQEFLPTTVQTGVVQIQRGVYGQITFRF